MHSSFNILKLLASFFTLLLESLNAQRLKGTRSKFSSRQSIFSRFLNPLRNLVGEFRSRRNKDFDKSVFPPETFLSTPEIIRFHGYPVEEHKVTVKDGYIISIFRITQTKKDDQSALKLEPVLIQHGFSCSSDDFLQLNPKDILPYLIADLGHNVWLGNVRGSTYCKEHTNNISANDPKFYDFTTDDLARDISVIIKYILKVENKPQLSYVGHSMGCALISMAVSENPGLNKVIKKASFIAPGIYFSNLSSPALRTLFSLPQSFLLTFSQYFAGGGMLPSNMTRKYAPKMCLRETGRNFCNRVMYFLGGLNPGQIKNDTLVKVFAHFPADTSMKLFTQFHQIFKTGLFQKYDYGTEENLELYGTTQPPLYTLSSVTFPVQGIFGLNDNLTYPQDALKTFSELGNLVETVQVEDENWTHFDFLYGKDAKKQVYDKIVQFLSSEK